MKNKNNFIILLCSLFIIEIIMFPKECINYTIGGSKLFFNSVFPSIFLFLFICNIIISYDGITIYSKAFGSLLCSPLRLPKECSIAIIISLLCGYPLGAKYSASLYENGVIEHKTFLRLVNIASNPSPLFIIGALGTSMFHNIRLGYIFLMASYSSCFLISLFIKQEKSTLIKSIKSNENLPRNNFGNAMKESVENAIISTLYIGGFIIIFYVITSIIKNNVLFNIVLNNISFNSKLPKDLLQGLTIGVLEITNGCFILSNNPTTSKILLISFIINFSGFSIISQVYSLIYKCDINLKKYVFRKFIQGILSSIITYIIIKISDNEISAFAINPKLYKENSLIFITICTILILPFIMHIIKKLFNIS